MKPWALWSLGAGGGAFVLADDSRTKTFLDSVGGAFSVGSKALDNLGSMVRGAGKDGAAAAGARAGLDHETLAVLLKQQEDRILQRVVRNQPTTVVLSGGQGSGRTGLVLAMLGVAGAGYVYMRWTGLPYSDLFPATRKGLAKLQEAVTSNLDSLWSGMLTELGFVKAQNEELKEGLGEANERIGEVGKGVGQLQDDVLSIRGDLQGVAQMQQFLLQVQVMVGRVLSGAAARMGQDSEDVRQLAALTSDAGSIPLAALGGEGPQQQRRIAQDAAASRPAGASGQWLPSFLSARPTLASESQAGLLSGGHFNTGTQGAPPNNLPLGPHRAATGLGGGVGVGVPVPYGAASATYPQPGPMSASYASMSRSQSLGAAAGRPHTPHTFNNYLRTTATDAQGGPQ